MQSHALEFLKAFSDLSTSKSTVLTTLAELEEELAESNMSMFKRIFDLVSYQMQQPRGTGSYAYLKTCINLIGNLLCGDAYMV